MFPGPTSLTDPPSPTLTNRSGGRDPVGESRPSLCKGPPSPNPAPSTARCPHSAPSCELRAKGGATFWNVPPVTEEVRGQRMESQRAGAQACVV